MKILLSFIILFVANTCLSQTETTSSIYKRIFDLSQTDYDQIESELGHYIETENVKMHYITYGDSTGTPFLWIPGTGSSSWEILNFRDSLENLNLFVIGIDYYGHGQTPMPKSEKSIYHIADDIKYLMDVLGIEKVIIGGWSRGGYIASAFYDEYPEAVLGLMLVDGGSANGLAPRYKMDRDSLRERYNNINLPEKLLTTYSTKFEAFCAFVDTNRIESQSWILDGLKIGLNGEWGYTTDIWPAVANESAESMLNSVEAPTLAPLLASSTYLMEPLIIYRNLDVPMIIIDPVNENDSWQNYTPENLELKNLYPQLVIHQIYENTPHDAHLSKPEWFIRDLKLLIEEINKRL